LIVADISYSSTRTIEQAPAVVHDRVLELARRLRDEAPTVPPGSGPASMLGVTGQLDVEIGDRGPNRIELRTTEGRIRVEAAADVIGRPDGRTDLTIGATIRPQGMGASLMLSAALGARPEIRQRVENGIEAAMDDLSTELAKPDDQWDASSWNPPGLGS
jgi:hypothetical protein